jgi:malate dehydrogenase (oxaloacetate-decarboxylating)
VFDHSVAPAVADAVRHAAQQAAAAGEVTAGL